MENIKYYKTRKVHNLREMLEECSILFGAKALFYEKEGEEYKATSFRQFYSDVQGLGTELCELGYAGKKIVVVGENCNAWCLAYMSVICGLGVAVPVDKEISGEEFLNIVKISGASLVIYSKKYGTKIENLPEGVESLCFDDLKEMAAEGHKKLALGNTRYRELSIDTDALASLIFTSGTTGAAKGVMLSQRNICFNIENLKKIVDVGPEDTALSVLTLHHVYECTIGFLFPMFCGAAIAFSEGVKFITRNMKEIRPTKIVCVPLLIETMYKKIWSNIRKKGIEKKVRGIIAATDKIKPYSARIALKRKIFSEIHESLGGKLNLLVSGGASIDPSVMKGMRGFGFNIIQGYGLTECAPLAAANCDFYFKDHAAGLPLPGGQIKIIDLSEDGTGEICYRGDNVMLGYYERPDLTAEVKKNGWLHTGDIGYIDRDGFLIITGRKKNVIITSNGKNIFPEELENYLCRSKFVAEAVVVGIMNEKKNDYDIVASVFPDTEQAKEILGPDYSEENLAKILKAEMGVINTTLQSYKKIDVLLISAAEFPKSTTRKIKRAEAYKLIHEQYKES